MPGIPDPGLWRRARCAQSVDATEIAVGTPLAAADSASLNGGRLCLPFMARIALRISITSFCRYRRPFRVTTESLRRKAPAEQQVCGELRHELGMQPGPMPHPTSGPQSWSQSL